jgi:hypothetical protein
VEGRSALTVFTLFPSLSILRMSLSSKSRHAHRDADANSYRIVAIHGLGAHPEYTWTSAFTRSTDPDHGKRVHLLRHLLTNDFPDARILAFAHNSDWLIDAPVTSAQQIGDRLLEELVKHRSKHQARTATPKEDKANRSHSAYRSSSSAIASGVSLSKRYAATPFPFIQT